MTGQATCTGGPRVQRSRAASHAPRTQCGPGAGAYRCDCQELRTTPCDGSGAREVVTAADEAHGEHATGHGGHLRPCRPM